MNRETFAPRLQLHSHDSFGLGHLRRTMTLAEALRQALPRSQILITTGSPCATAFPHAAGIDLVKLPSVTKDSTGQYVPRSLGGSLDFVVRLRRELLLQIQNSFRPHALIVDHQILGLDRELEAVLQCARTQGTRTLLGVRDIIDAPDVVAREWGQPHVREALAQSYDRVCVYGDPQVFDPREHYSNPGELTQRLEFVGYVARNTCDQIRVPTTSSRHARPHLLVTVGGGEDGSERIDTLLEALEQGPVDFHTTILLGPMANPARTKEFKRRARALDNVQAQLFHADIPYLLSQSDAVVSMAGYNSVVEILQSGVPAILCPRSFPRREQLIRAQRLAAMGLVTCLPNPTALELRSTILEVLARGPQVLSLPRMDGAQALAEIVVQELAMTPAQLQRSCTP